MQHECMEEGEPSRRQSLCAAPPPRRSHLRAAQRAEFAAESHSIVSEQRASGGLVGEGGAHHSLRGGQPGMQMPASLVLLLEDVQSYAMLPMSRQLRQRTRLCTAGTGLRTSPGKSVHWSPHMGEGHRKTSGWRLLTREAERREEAFCGVVG